MPLEADVASQPPLVDFYVFASDRTVGETSRCENADRTPVELKESGRIGGSGEVTARPETWGGIQ